MQLWVPARPSLLVPVLLFSVALSSAFWALGSSLYVILFLKEKPAFAAEEPSPIASCPKKFGDLKALHLGFSLFLFV